MEDLLSDYVSVNAVTDLLNRIFFILPDAKMGSNDKWRRDLTLITKAPVRINNFYTFMQRKGDSAFINIDAVRYAQRVEGDTPYMKGKMYGNATLSYSTGMPDDYETRSETQTATNYYVIAEKEVFRVRRVKSLK